MKIAIIGAGNVGKALGQSFTRAGHDVTYAAQSESAHEAAALTDGATAAPNPVEAARNADVVVLAVPWTALDGLTRDLRPVVHGKLVIDPTNPLTPDYSDLATRGGASGAERIAAALPGARVVKAFNTIFSSLQAEPGTHGVTVDALYATDDERARAEVASLIESIGFRPVAVGPLARAAELESLAFLNIQLQMVTGGDWDTAVTLVSPPPAATEVPQPALSRR